MWYWFKWIRNVHTCPIRVCFLFVRSFFRWKNEFILNRSIIQSNPNGTNWVSKWKKDRRYVYRDRLERETFVCLLFIFEVDFRKGTVTQLLSPRSEPTNEIIRHVCEISVSSNCHVNRRLLLMLLFPLFLSILPSFAVLTSIVTDLLCVCVRSWFFFIQFVWTLFGTWYEEWETEKEKIKKSTLIRSDPIQSNSIQSHWELARNSHFKAPREQVAFVTNVFCQ